MDLAVEEGQKRSLSDLEIFEITREKCEIRFYHELSKCKDLRQVLGPHGAAIILYETKARYGHWVAIHQVDENTIEFYDPYALRPDSEEKFIPPEGKAEQQIGRLTELIEHAAQSMRIIYNMAPLQRFAADCDTCGRWCAVRIRKRGMTLKRFQEFFFKQSQSPDWLITALTLIFDSSN